ncbi:MAG TPA: hypothetical protein DEF27_01560 [Oscillatoriales bacterium UBA8482]|nr:hypothetical protein [Oscillatoriales bacterium UBA8482]
MKNNLELELKFHEAMIEIYEQAKSELKYNATRFLQAVNEHGGLKAAKIFLNTKGFSYGFIELWERGRLDLTMEAMIVKNSKWHGLFTKQELLIAKKRLVDLGYKLRKIKIKAITD